MGEWGPKPKWGPGAKPQYSEMKYPVSRSFFDVCMLKSCNHLLAGAADSQMKRLQSVQNTAARLVTRRTLVSKERGLDKDNKVEQSIWQLAYVFTKSRFI